VASHDLREPLRTVTSYLQLLKERYSSKMGSDADEFIEFAVDGSRRMKELIDSLLAYSRVETHQQNFTTIDFAKVLAEVSEQLKSSIDESGATIISEPLPQVRGDEQLLVQLFQNLFSNAIKYQAGRKPEIHISAERRGEAWQFAVRDNGIGIESQYLERIFVIFQRLHNRSQYPGTGIGLSICRKVIEHHGGRIWAESEKGTGTTFYFTIPMHEARSKVEGRLRTPAHTDPIDPFGPPASAPL
jgi:light-regulated signal transduction histidine kinase (bacteriophytochrome)